METYTNEQKSEMYRSASEDLTNVVVGLRGFIEAAADEESDEVIQARTTADRLVTLIGNYKVREKQSLTETE